MLDGAEVRPMVFACWHLRFRLANSANVQICVRAATRGFLRHFASFWYGRAKVDGNTQNTGIVDLFIRCSRLQDETTTVLSISPTLPFRLMPCSRILSHCAMLLFSWSPTRPS